MDDLRVTIDFISPAFLGGPEARGEPQLREASLRGALRYWLRALLCEQNISGLREKEGYVFGNTGQGGGASAVIVRTQKGTSIKRKSVEECTQGFPKPQPGQPLPGIHYALFSMKANKGLNARTALTGSFTLTLSRRLGVFSSRSMRNAYAALWCLTHLGSIGARSRRGFGAIQAISGTAAPTWAKDLSSLEVQAANPESLRDEIEQGLQQIKAVLGLPTVYVSSSGYDMLAPGACKIFVVDQTFNSELHAVHQVVGALAKFRHLRQPDYGLVKTALTGGSLTGAVERAAFGLPIVFGFHDVPLRKPLEADPIKRRSSPLWIRPVRLVNGQYAVVIIFFKSDLLPSGSTLSINHKQGPVPALTVVEEFLKRQQTPAPAKNPSLPEQSFALLEVAL